MKARVLKEIVSVQVQKVRALVKFLQGHPTSLVKVNYDDATQTQDLGAGANTRN